MRLDIPGTPFDIVVADFPWWYPAVAHDAKRKNTAARHYPLMRDDDVLATNVEDVITDDGVLFLWATCPRLDIAMRLGEQRGLRFSGVPFVWIKTRRSDGAVSGAQGMPPRIVKPNAELVIAFTRQRRIIRPDDFSVQQVVLAPRREHSRKPDEVYNRIDRLYPSARKLEMFARQQRDGWSVWGNETSKFSA